jgi:hypothetical protein
LLADKEKSMKRLRISPFQAAILRRIREMEPIHGGCAPDSPNSKIALYGRRGGFSTSERVTLHRSIRRLVANAMIATPEGSGRGWFRLTEKGRAWLVAHEDRTPLHNPG